MHFWMEFVKKTLRYYAVTCTFAMCMAHDVRHLRPVHNEATIFLAFARTGSQFTRLIFLAKSQQVLHAHRKSIYAPDFSRQITKSHVVLLFLETISMLTSDAIKFEPYRICPSAFNTTFWQFFDFILKISHNKTFKIWYIRCWYIVI